MAGLCTWYCYRAPDHTQIHTFLGPLIPAAMGPPESLGKGESMRTKIFRYCQFTAVLLGCSLAAAGVRSETVCSTDTTWLHFGPNGEQHQVIFNSSRLAMRCLAESPGNMVIDGHDLSGPLQATLILGQSARRLAFNTIDWNSWACLAPEPDVFSYRSFVPVPEAGSGSCKPAAATGVPGPLGSATGYQYTPINTNVVSTSYVDSAQLWLDATGQWDWSLVRTDSAPYSADSTIGVAVESRTVGVQDGLHGQMFASLDNLTVTRIALRNVSGHRLEGLALGQLCEYGQSPFWVHMNREFSSFWISDLNGARSWGVTKLPFGHHDTSLIGGVVMQMSLISPVRYTYFERAYEMLSELPPGLSFWTWLPVDEPRYYHLTLARDISLEPDDTYTLAVVQFSLTDLADPSDSANAAVGQLAALANKFAGFGRGDVNNDNAVNLTDLVLLANHLFRDGPGPIPFRHLGDVNIDGRISLSDVTYLLNFYFFGGAPPLGEWEI